MLSGCYECSQRRINCDRSEPSCYKCASRGLVCSGLEPKYTFLDGFASGRSSTRSDHKNQGMKQLRESTQNTLQPTQSDANSSHVHTQGTSDHQKQPLFDFGSQGPLLVPQNKAGSSSPELLGPTGFFNLDILQDLQVWDELRPMSDFDRTVHQDNAYTLPTATFVGDASPLSGSWQFSNMGSHSWPG